MNVCFIKNWYLIKDDAGSLVKESSEEEIIAFVLSICMSDHAMIYISKP
jgi:hypothetical protein